MSELRERVISLIDASVRVHARYAYLEERTGIAARKWKNMCNRVTQPSHEMLTALAEFSPHYASWMLTGRAVDLQIALGEEDRLLEELGQGLQVELRRE